MTKSRKKQNTCLCAEGLSTNLPPFYGAAGYAGVDLKKKEERNTKPLEEKNVRSKSKFVILTITSLKNVRTYKSTRT